MPSETVHCAYHNSEMSALATPTATYLSVRMRLSCSGRLVVVSAFVLES